METEEDKYTALKGTIERSGKGSDDFNDSELKIFFNATEEQIKKLREEKPERKEVNPARVFTKLGQAEDFIEQQPLFYDKAGSFWLWRYYKWERVDETDILNSIEENLNIDTISSKSRTEILNALKQVGRKKIPQEIKGTWIQFKDKIYDVKTGESFQATPEYFVTNPIPWEVSMNPETPTIDKIFEEWVGKEYVQTLYEVISYCLIPDYPIHRLFCFIGEGMNGKSKFLELIRLFIGNDNICATELDLLLSSRFEITRLYKKLACVMGETNFAEMNKTSVIKKLTGQDIINFEYKNKDLFEGKNYAKVLLATNNLPATTDKTIGFYRRWVLIDFPNRFTEKKDILGDIPIEEYNNLATRCLTILSDLLKKRGFHNEGTVEERMQRFEDRSNPFDKFWKETIEEVYESYISKKQFSTKLNEWCKENRFRSMSDISIAKHMKDKGVETGRRTMEWVDTKGEKPRYNVWEGIKFNG